MGPFWTIILPLGGSVLDDHFHVQRLDLPRCTRYSPDQTILPVCFSVVAIEDLLYMGPSTEEG